MKQESIWDFPRPPRIEPVHHVVTVRLGGRVIVETSRALRCIETSQPPTYYIPRSEVARAEFREVPGSSLCEYKGRARYFDVVAGRAVARRAAWCYPDPPPPYDTIAGCVAFIAGAMEECRVGAMPVSAQDGDYCGGWITPNLIGPFKGPPGTANW